MISVLGKKPIFREEYYDIELQLRPWAIKARKPRIKTIIGLTSCNHQSLKSIFFAIYAKRTLQLNFQTWRLGTCYDHRFMCVLPFYKWIFYFIKWKSSIIHLRLLYVYVNCKCTILTIWAAQTTVSQKKIHPLIT